MVRFGNKKSVSWRFCRDTLQIYLSFKANPIIIHNRFEPVLSSQTSITQIAFRVWPMLQATIVKPLQFIGDDERDMPIRHTFLEHNEPSHTSVPVLERMNPLETMMEIKNIIKRFLLLDIVILQQSFHFLTHLFR